MPSDRQRTSANAPDASTVTLNEKILKECHDLYTEKDRGSVFRLFITYVDVEPYDGGTAEDPKRSNTHK